MLINLRNNLRVERHEWKYAQGEITEDSPHNVETIRFYHFDFAQIFLNQIADFIEVAKDDFLRNNWNLFSEVASKLKDDSIDMSSEELMYREIRTFLYLTAPAEHTYNYTDFSLRRKRIFNWNNFDYTKAFRKSFNVAYGNRDILKDKYIKSAMKFGSEDPSISELYNALMEATYIQFPKPMSLPRWIKYYAKILMKVGKYDDDLEKEKIDKVTPQVYKDMKIIAGEERANARLRENIETEIEKLKEIFQRIQTYNLFYSARQKGLQNAIRNIDQETISEIYSTINFIKKTNQKLLKSAKAKESKEWHEEFDKRIDFYLQMGGFTLAAKLLFFIDELEPKENLSQVVSIFLEGRIGKMIKSFAKSILDDIMTAEANNGNPLTKEERRLYYIYYFGIKALGDTKPVLNQVLVNSVYPYLDMSSLFLSLIVFRSIKTNKQAVEASFKRRLLLNFNMIKQWHEIVKLDEYEETSNKAYEKRASTFNEEVFSINDHPDSNYYEMNEIYADEKLTVIPHEGTDSYGFKDEDIDAMEFENIELFQEILTEKEFEVIYNLFYQKCTQADIANLKGVSIQAINKLYKSALDKIKKTEKFNDMKQYFN